MKRRKNRKRIGSTNRMNTDVYMSLKFLKQKELEKKKQKKRKNKIALEMKNKNKRN